MAPPLLAQNEETGEWESTLGAEEITKVVLSNEERQVDVTRLVMEHIAQWRRDNPPYTEVERVQKAADRMLARELRCLREAAEAKEAELLRQQNVMRAAMREEQEALQRQLAELAESHRQLLAERASQRVVEKTEEVSVMEREEELSGQSGGARHPKPAPSTPFLRAEGRARQEGYEKLERGESFTDEQGRPLEGRRTGLPRLTQRETGDFLMLTYHHVRRTIEETPGWKETRPDLVEARIQELTRIWPALRATWSTMTRMTTAGSNRRAKPVDGMNDITYGLGNPLLQFAMDGMSYLGGHWLFRPPVQLTSPMRDAFSRFWRCLLEDLELSETDCRRSYTAWRGVPAEIDDPFSVVIKRHSLTLSDYGLPTSLQVRHLTNLANLFPLRSKEPVPATAPRQESWRRPDDRNRDSSGGRDGPNRWNDYNSREARGRPTPRRDWLGPMKGEGRDNATRGGYGSGYGEDENDDDEVGDEDTYSTMPLREYRGEVLTPSTHLSVLSLSRTAVECWWNLDEHLQSGPEGMSFTQEFLQLLSRLLKETPVGGYYPPREAWSALLAHEERYVEVRQMHNWPKTEGQTQRGLVSRSQAFDVGNYLGILMGIRLAPEGVDLFTQTPRGNCVIKTELTDKEGRLIVLDFHPAVARSNWGYMNDYRGFAEGPNLIWKPHTLVVQSVSAIPGGSALWADYGDEYSLPEVPSPTRNLRLKERTTEEVSSPTRYAYPRQGKTEDGSKITSVSSTDSRATPWNFCWRVEGKTGGQWSLEYCKFILLLNDEFVRSQRAVSLEELATAYLPVAPQRNARLTDTTLKIRMAPSAEVAMQLAIPLVQTIMNTYNILFEQAGISHQMAVQYMKGGLLCDTNVVPGCGMSAQAYWKAMWETNAFMIPNHDELEHAVPADSVPLLNITGDLKPLTSPASNPRLLTAYYRGAYMALQRLYAYVFGFVFDPAKQIRKIEALRLEQGDFSGGMLFFQQVMVLHSAVPMAQRMNNQAVYSAVSKALLDSPNGQTLYEQLMQQLSMVRTQQNLAVVVDEMRKDLTTLSLAMAALAKIAEDKNRMTISPVKKKPLRLELSGMAGFRRPDNLAADPLEEQSMGLMARMARGCFLCGQDHRARDCAYGRATPKGCFIDFTGLRKRPRQEVEQFLARCREAGALARTVDQKTKDYVEAQFQDVLASLPTPSTAAAGVPLDSESDEHVSAF